MAQSLRSFRVTDAYRAGLLALAKQSVETIADAFPRSLDALKQPSWTGWAAETLEASQNRALALTSAYLGAYAFTEGASGTPATITPGYAGVTRFGDPLPKAMSGTVAAVWAMVGEDGRDPEEAITVALSRLRQMVDFEIVQMAREACMGTMQHDDRFKSFERAVAGTCAGCMSLSGNIGDLGLGPDVFETFDTHPWCKCIPQPRVNGALDIVNLPLPTQLFQALSEKEEGELLRDIAPKLIRIGKEELKDQVKETVLRKAKGPSPEEQEQHKQRREHLRFIREQTHAELESEDVTVPKVSIGEEELADIERERIRRENEERQAQIAAIEGAPVAPLYAVTPPTE